MKEFYAYTLAYPDGTVFYVGKGTGKRIDAHCKEAKRGVESYKCRIIRKIWNEGGQVLQQKVAFFNTEQEAYDFEELLIAFFGRHTLANLTDGGEGAAIGNQNARLSKHSRIAIGFSGPTVDLIYEALAMEGNINPSNDEIRDAIYYAIRQVYGRRIEEGAIIA